MSNERNGVRELFRRVDEKITNKKWVAEAVVIQTRASDRRVKVAILPELIETNWIRLYMFNSGTGYASGTMPPVDANVLLLFIEGDRDGAVCLGGSLPDDSDGVQSLGDPAEINFQDRFGNKINMTSAGINITAAGNVTINGTNAKVNNGTGLQGAVRKSDQLMSGFGPVAIITASTNTFIGG